MTPEKKRRESLIERIGIDLQVLPRLFLDRRMPFWLKLLPVLGLAFLISPVDFPSMLDDVIVLVITIFLFYELTPQKLMEEHREAVRNQIDADWHEAPAPKEEIIDGKFQNNDNYKDNIGK